MTKTKLTVLGGLMVLAVAGPLVVQHKDRARLLAENVDLRQQLDELTQLRTENERLSNLLAQANDKQGLPNDSLNELLRLRGEVGQLREQNKAMDQLRQQLRGAQAANGNGIDPLSQYMGSPIAAPQNLSPAYSKDGLLRALQAAAQNAGISIKTVQADDSEFPCLLGVITAPGDWEKLKTQIKKLEGYSYSGSVGSDEYNAINITPQTAFPSETAQTINRRLTLRMQRLAGQLEQIKNTL